MTAARWMLYAGAAFCAIVSIACVLISPALAAATAASLGFLVLAALLDYFARRHAFAPHKGKSHGR